MLQLERFTPDDIDRLIGWIPDEEFLIQWSGPAFRFPLDRDQLLRNLETPDRRVYKATASETGQVVGHCELGVNLLHRTARIGRFLIGPLEWRRKGYGLRMMDALLQIAFGELSLHRVDLGVFEFNRAAIACYEKAGFVTEGVMRDWVRVKDAYWNCRMMSILEDEWRERRKG
jgi:RimJ/RimL family protein N-acetyltransferase